MIKYLTILLFILLSSCIVKTEREKGTIDTLSIMHDILSNRHLDSMYRPIFEDKKMIVVKFDWMKNTYFSGYESNLSFIPPNESWMDDTTKIKENPFIVRISTPVPAGKDSVEMYFDVHPIGSEAELLYVRQSNNVWKNVSCKFHRY